MNRSNHRPSGRKKRVGSSRASVKRRGSSLGHKTGGRVGSAKGYRRSNPTTFRPSSPSSSGHGNLGSMLPRMSMKTMVLLGLIAFAIYFFFFRGSGLDLTSLDSINETPSLVNNSSDSLGPSSSTSLDRSVSALAREKRTTILGNGKDTVTLMVYMIGTDLETKSGMATGDLTEMLNADLSDQVNLIVQTGGTKTWQNKVISNKTNQRYQLTSEGLIALEEDLGKTSMVDPDTLADFIVYSKSAFPADRYMLILWDHGGGSLSGYGYDEYFPGDTMTLDEIDEALDKGNTAFDFIGFDACLMATLETAMVVEPYSDYMIASEELEPGIGWYYTDWLSTLSNNTSIETIDLGKKLIDDYVAKVASDAPRNQGTLSLIDLAEMKGTIPASLSEFSVATKALIDTEQYDVVSSARAGAKEFAKSSKLNQIDLIHFAKTMGTESSLELADSLDGIIKYNRTTSNISNANGVSIYFPLTSLNKVGDMVDTYQEIGMEDAYTDCVRTFASVVAGGQLVANERTGGSDGLLGSLLGGGGDLVGTIGSQVIGGLISNTLSGGGLGGLLGNNTSWVDEEAMTSSTDYYAENQLDLSALVISKKDGQNVLALSEEQWALIQYMEQNVFIDDGAGFIDLGLDNTYEWNADGDLIMDYDGTWIAINGQIVSYYMISDDHSGDRYSIRGRVPALLNDEPVNIILEFNESDPYGTVLGAQYDYDVEAETPTLAKGLTQIVNGDQIDYLCDYYTYDGDYSDSYYLGDTYRATGDWYIENLDISDYSYEMAYRITDIYDNQYWTPTVSD